MLCQVDCVKDPLSPEVIENLTQSETMLASLKILFLASQPLPVYKNASRWLEKVADKSPEILNEYQCLPLKKQTERKLKEIIMKKTGGYYC